MNPEILFLVQTHIQQAIERYMAAFHHELLSRAMFRFARIPADVQELITALPTLTHESEQNFADCKIACAYIRQRQFALAQPWIEKVRSQDIHHWLASNLAMLSLAYTEAGEDVLAKNYLDEALQHHITYQRYDFLPTFLIALAQAGEAERALVLNRAWPTNLQAVLQWFATEKSLPKEFFQLRQRNFLPLRLIHLAEQGQFEAAIHLWKTAPQDFGFAIQVLLRELAKAHQLEAILNLLNHYAADSVIDEWVNARCQMLAVVLPFFPDLLDASLALEETVTPDDVKARSLAMLARGIAAHDRSLSEQLFERAIVLGEGEEATRWQRDFVLGDIVIELVNAGFLGRALALLKTLNGERYHFDRAVIDHFTAQRDYEMVYNLVKIHQLSYEGELAEEILGVIIANGDLAQAIELKTLLNFEYKGDGYIADGMALAKRFSEAFTWLESVQVWPLWIDHILSWLPAFESYEQGLGFAITKTLAQTLKPYFPQLEMIEQAIP